MLSLPANARPNLNGERPTMKASYPICSSLFAIAAISSLASPAVSQPVQWKLEDGGNGHWYEIIDSFVSWPVANGDAMRRSYAGLEGHLGTIHSETENDFVLQLTSEELGPNKTDTVWLGLTDSEAFGGNESFESGIPARQTDGWVWVTGEPVSFVNWVEGQPTNADGNPEVGAEGADYATMRGRGHFVSERRGEWRDGDYRWTIGYVVEYESFLGDLNQDGFVDDSDIDVAFEHVDTATIDLNFDGSTNAADVNYLITELVGIPPGDANLDGIVDLADFSTLKSNFAQTSKGWRDGDFNGNAVVELDDFRILKDHFGATRTNASVPEPGSRLLAAFAILSTAALRRFQGRRRVLAEVT